MGTLNEKNGKTYTAQEIIDIIDEGWETEEELKQLYDFFESAQLKNDEELAKLCDSGYGNIVYDAYETIRNKYGK